ncbi:MAG: lysozyme [Lachnospiraceae bacterium]|nr:lysozyme [Lachnospiraceae bacterium]
MGLTTSDTGLELIKQFEGCKLTAYQDSVGVWTIGYGHTSGVKRGQTITQAQATAYLKADLATAEACVNKYYSTYKWNQNQFDALVSFAFNIGSIKGLTASGTRSIATISAKIPEYNKAGGKTLAGLVTRRAAEKKLFDTAVTTTTSSSSSSAPTYKVGSTYTLQVELKVREAAGTDADALTHSELTTNAQKNDTDNDGALDKGTKVTCQELKTIGNDIWMRIPSGWIAAYYNGQVYVK